MTKIALIPAYHPGQELAHLVKGLASAGFKTVIVDDGSGDGYEKYFLVEVAGINRYQAKILTEIVMFSFSYIMQHRFVFREKGEEGKGATGIRVCYPEWHPLPGYGFFRAGRPGGL